MKQQEKSKGHKSKDDHISPFFALRTPLLTVSHLDLLYADLSKGAEGQHTAIFSVFQDTTLQEALYLASPSLHARLVSKLEGKVIESKEEKRLAISLLKYYTRLCSRCTPFGLFANSSVGLFGSETNLNNVPTNAIRRHVRLDMDYLCNLGHYLSLQAGIKEQLSYFPNSSLYRLKNKFRYVEQRHDGKNWRSHHLVSIDFNIYTNLIIKRAKEGLQYNELIGLLESVDVDRDSAKTFVDELIDSQVIQSSLEPNVTGPEYFDILLDQVSGLKELNPSILNIKSTLLSVNQEIKNIRNDCGGYDSYREIVKALKEINVPFDEQRLFQVDCFRESAGQTLDRNVLPHIKEALECLSVLSQLSKQRKTQIEVFKDAFLEKYETRTVRLVEAVDSEIGLGYKNAKTTSGTHERNEPIENNVSRLKYKKFYDCIRTGGFIIEITDDDIKYIGEGLKPTLPDYFGVMINLLQAGPTNDDPYIELKMVNVAPANLLGRFCHGDKVLYKRMQELIGMEDKNVEGVPAEVAHLPQSRIGNVLARPHLREYEIEYLARSPLPRNKTLAVDDLYVKVRQNRLVLLSKRLNQEILPRLSSAHNFSSRSLPVYNFLCDVQYQGRNFQAFWDWETLNGQPFLPRVVYKKVIIQPAQWNLSHKYVETFFGRKIEDLKGDWFNQLRTKLSIPERFYLVEGDNILLLDVSVPYCIEVIKDKLKKGTVALKEFLATNPAENGMQTSNEILIPFIRKKMTSENLIKKPKTFNDTYFSASIKRDFFPGSSWLYLKFYVNKATADSILMSIEPLVKGLLRGKLIDRWFFLRYFDPKHHLRVRFSVTDRQHLGTVLATVHSMLGTFISRGSMQDIKLEVYKREIERYGRLTMDLSEHIFSINSSLVCELLSGYAQGKIAIAREVLAAYLIDRMMNVSNYSLKEKVTFYEANMKGFMNEFNIARDKAAKLHLSAIKREKRNEIDQIFSGITLNSGNPFYALILSYEDAYRQVVGNVITILKKRSANHPPRDSVIASYHHMFVNRLFPDEQRKAELIIYSLLFNHYRSYLAKQRLANASA